MTKTDILSAVIYKSKLDDHKWEQVKLVKNGVSRKTYVYETKLGVEGADKVLEKYLKTADKLDFTVAEIWSEVEEVLDSTTYDKFELIRRANYNTAALRTRANFVNACNALLSKIAPGKKPRDTAFAYIRNDVKKARHASVEEHVDRVQKMIALANKLAGDEPVIEGVRLLKMILGSFPQEWQDAYTTSARNIDEDTIEGIVDYMQAMKEVKDRAGAEEKKKKQKTEKDNNNGSDRIRGGGGGSAKKKSKGNHYEKKALKDDDTCPIHGFHKWGECSLNPRGSNYQKRMGGRGGGRGNYDRNDGNRSRNNYSHNRDRGNYTGGGRGDDRRDNRGQGGRGGGGNNRGGDNYHNDFNDNNNNNGDQQNGGRRENEESRDAYFSQEGSWREQTRGSFGNSRRW